MRACAERQPFTSLGPLITIELFGQPYTFRADAEVGKAKRVADTVVRTVAEIEARRSAATSQTVNLATMILAALNIADENHELKSKYTELVETLSERSRRLDRLLESGLTADRTAAPVKSTGVAD